MMNQTDSRPFKEATEVFDTLTATQEKIQTQELARQAKTDVTKKSDEEEDVSPLMNTITAVLVLGIMAFSIMGSFVLMNNVKSSKAEASTLDTEIQAVSDQLEVYYDQNNVYPEEINSLITTAAQKTGIPVSDFCYAPQKDRNAQNYIFGVRSGSDEGTWKARISAISDGKLEYIGTSQPNCF